MNEWENFDEYLRQEHEHEVGQAMIAMLAKAKEEPGIELRSCFEDMRRKASAVVLREALTRLLYAGRLVLTADRRLYLVA